MIYKCLVTQVDMYTIGQIRKCDTCMSYATEQGPNALMCKLVYTTDGPRLVADAQV